MYQAWTKFFHNIAHLVLRTGLEAAISPTITGEEQIYQYGIHGP